MNWRPWASCLLAAVAGCQTPNWAWKGPLGSIEDACVYQPSQYPAGEWTDVNLAFEDAWFQAADGTRLHGWYVPHPQPRAVVLYAHGNNGNVADLADLLEHLNEEHALAVLAFDYRGFGRSEGSPDEPGLQEDARAARAWLAQRTGIAESDVVLMGRSLGGGVMVDLASRDGARGLILESTFTSLPNVARSHPLWYGAGWLMRSQFDSLDKLADYRGPLLLSHGERDRLIPHSHGRKLFAAAPGPKRMITIAGAGHNDPQSAEYYAALDGFLDSLPPEYETIATRPAK